MAEQINQKQDGSFEEQIKPNFPRLHAGTSKRKTV